MKMKGILIMSMQVQSQSYKNQPAFGCVKCSMVRAFLVDGRISKDVARDYVTLKVPETSKTHSRDADKLLKKVVTNFSEVVEDIRNQISSGCIKG